MYQSSDSLMAHHAHVGVDPTGMGEEGIRQVISARGGVLRERMLQRGLRYVTISDKIEPDHYSYFFDGLIDHPQLMGLDCRIVGRKGQYLAAYFNGRHGFDAIRFVEFETDLGDLIVLGPKTTVLSRIDINGAWTNAIYSIDDRGRKTQNKPIRFEDAVRQYGGTDSLYLILPHPTLMFAGVFRSENMCQLSGVWPFSGNRERLEGIIAMIENREIGWESFNASTAWFQRERTMRIFEFLISRDGSVPKGLVADDMEIDWTGHNTMKLQIPFNHVPDYGSEDEALRLLDYRVSEAAQALKASRFDVVSRQKAPIRAFGRKIRKHAKWAAQHAIGTAT